MYPKSQFQPQRNATGWSTFFGSSTSKSTANNMDTVKARSPDFSRTSPAQSQPSMLLPLGASSAAMARAPGLVAPCRGEGPFWMNYQRQRDELVGQWTDLEARLGDIQNQCRGLNFSRRSRELQGERPRLDNAMHRIGSDIANLDAAAARLHEAERTREPGAASMVAESLAAEASLSARDAHKELDRAAVVALNKLAAPTAVRSRMRELTAELLALDLDGKRQAARRLDKLATETRDAAWAHAAFDAQTHFSFRPQPDPQVVVHLEFADAPSLPKPEEPAIHFRFEETKPAPGSAHSTPSRSQPWHAFGTPYATPSASRQASPSASPFVSPFASPTKSSPAKRLQTLQQQPASQLRTPAASIRRLSFSDSNMSEASAGSGTLY